VFGRSIASSPSLFFFLPVCASFVLSFARLGWAEGSVSQTEKKEITVLTPASMHTVQIPHPTTRTAVHLLTIILSARSLSDSSVFLHIEGSLIPCFYSMEQRNAGTEGEEKKRGRKMWAKKEGLQN